MCFGRDGPATTFSPKSLADVFADIAAIARIMGAEQRGLEVIFRMRNEIDTMQQATSHVERPLVYCEEWGKPLILSQPWVAELVEAVGGRFFGTPGKQVTEEEVTAANPQVIVAAWCGAGDRVPLEKIVARRGWQQTSAARAERVYCINDEYLNTPASTLVNGLRALAAAIHPEVFAGAEGLRAIAAQNQHL